MKKSLSLISGLLFAISSVAQDTGSAGGSFRKDPFNDPMLPYYLVFALLLLSTVLVSVVAVYVFRITKLMKNQVQGITETTPVIHAHRPGWWATFTQKINASVPVDQEKHIELAHSYDGIKELDNHLPPWWKWLFYGTIGWAVIYIFVFHLSGSLPLSEEEYQHELALAEEQARQRKASQPASEAIDESMMVFSNDAAIIEKGKNVFNSNPCGSCHRNDGGGNTIGPNLTDEYWIHGGDLKSIFNTIKNGAVDKGMPAWGKAMSAQDLRDVTFYIMSLQGTTPPNAKGPQGELFQQTTSVKTDSTGSQASL